MSGTAIAGAAFGDSPEESKRREARYRSLGSRTPVCAWPDCDETDPLVLMGHFPDIHCYEHYLLRSEKKPFEAHHVAGRHNSDVTADVPGNEHRLLSECQGFWSEDTLRNPEHSPLLVAAAAIRGWLDVMQVIIDRSIGWIPEFLEWLHRILVDQIGSDWWVKFEWPGVQGA